MVQLSRSLFAASFLVSALQGGIAATCSGARSLSVCAEFINPYSENALTWQTECGIQPPASGVDMLMAQGLQFNTGSCASGTTATCCTACLACGNVGVDCSGPATGAAPSSGTALPQGWSVAIPCAVDNADRVLSDITVTYLATTTPASCAAQCAAKGFTFAGVEYSDECYCGSGFLDNVTPPTAPTTDCNMTCAGDSAQTCGGPWRIQLYKSQ